MTTKPKLPTLRALTRELRELHEAWDCGEHVILVRELIVGGPGCEPNWQAMPRSRAADYEFSLGRDANVYIPGQLHVGAPFDAVAAARRLLAAAKEQAR